MANKVIRKKEFTIEGNIIHYSFTKSKRVIRNILALELYSIIGGMDMAISINIIIKIIMKQLNYAEIPIIICTNLYFLYNYLVKFGIIKEKKLIINIIAIQ